VVDYPLEIDMGRYLVVPQKDSEEKYRHDAVSNHFGLLQSRDEIFDLGRVIIEKR
jgi:hypothetical protein